MRAKTFYGWLKLQRNRNDPVGDLAHDAIADKGFPRAARALRTYERHLNRMGASFNAMRSFERAWNEWSAYQERPANEETL